MQLADLADREFYFRNMKCLVFFLITLGLAVAFPLQNGKGTKLQAKIMDPAMREKKMIGTPLNDPNDNSGWNGGANNNNAGWYGGAGNINTNWYGGQDNQNQGWNGGNTNNNYGWQGGAGNINTDWSGGYNNQNQGWNGGLYGK